MSAILTLKGGSASLAQDLTVIPFLMEAMEALISQANNDEDKIGSRGGFIDIYLIQSMVRDIQAKQERLAQLKKLLSESCKGNEIDLLQSIKGIGAYSASCIMIQIEDIARFPTAKHLPDTLACIPLLGKVVIKSTCRV